MEEAEAERALQSAREAFLREDYEACVRIARETLEQLPPADIAEELRALRFTAKRRLLEREVLDVRVVPDREVYTVGEELAVTLLLRNVSPSAL